MTTPDPTATISSRSPRGISDDRVPVPRIVWSRLTITRGICALYVVVSHTWFQVWPAAHPPLGYAHRPNGAIGWATSWLYHGHFAVIAFIVVSGYSLQAARLSRGGRFDTWSFIVRRCRRILPPYYAAFVFSAVIGLLVVTHIEHNQWDISIPVSLRSLITHALLLQDVVDNTTINYAHWSIAAEFHLYLLFPLLIVLIGRIGSVRTLSVVATFTGALIVVVTVVSPRTPAAFLGLIVYFTLGACAAQYSAAHRYQLNAGHRRRWRRSGVALLLVVAAVVLAAGFDRTESYLLVVDTTTAIAIASLAIAMSPDTTPTATTATCRAPLRAQIRCQIARCAEGLGRFSYSLYLVHAPIIAMVWLALHRICPLSDTCTFALLLPIATAASLLFAYLFYRMFEKPFT